MPRTLTIRKEGKSLYVDDLSRAGSPPIGLGETLEEAIGNYFINNQKAFDIIFDVQPTALTAEDKRRRKALKER